MKCSHAENRGNECAYEVWDEEKDVLKSECPRSYDRSGYQDSYFYSNIVGFCRYKEKDSYKPRKRR